MRSQYIGIFVLALTFVISSTKVYAQASQYKRAEKPASTKKKSNEKLDISDLEKRYWAPKDTEFKVVQNRKFTKANRYQFSLAMGKVINDVFEEGSATSLSFGYFFDEKNGVEVLYESYDLSDNDVTAQVKSAGGAPEFGSEKTFYGVKYNWIPFYGKLSVLDSNIIYFDMALSAGLGMMNYEQDRATAANPSASAVALIVDITQQYFFTKHFSLRVDFKNRIYNEEKINSDTGVSLGSSTRFSTYIMFGGTYYY